MTEQSPRNLSSLLRARLEQPAAQNELMRLYGTDPDECRAQTERLADMAGKLDLIASGTEPIRVFSSPGRTEIGGNHTDHQGGTVLCAAIRQDIVAVVRMNEDGVIRLQSEGFKSRILIDLTGLTPESRESGRSPALIRGVASWFHAHGYRIGGFDAYTTSRLPRGSGLSSSAAFELLIAEILNTLYNDGNVSPIEKAQAARYAENEFYGKPCGLMDQMAIALGGINEIRFADPDHPDVRRVADAFLPDGPAVVVTHTGGSHASLSDHYASIPVEMHLVARAFGAERLQDVAPDAFIDKISGLIRKVPARALMRAMHFFDESQRAEQEAEALRCGDQDRFLQLVRRSGRSSWTLLQNVYVPESGLDQNLALGLALSERLLRGAGAVRVHGGGFAGTFQAFVPRTHLDRYLAAMRDCFGSDAPTVLQVRSDGAREVWIP